MNVAPVPAPALTRLALCLCGAALVMTAHALNLPEALARADARTAVVNADSTLRDAERTLERTENDPLALRPDLVDAEQAVRLAEAELRAARLEARREILGAYADARAAELRHGAALAARDLAQRSLEVTRLRFERGGATQLDVDEAATELADAEANVAAARNGLELARSNLASLVDAEVADLEPIDGARVEAPLPPLEAWTARLEDHPAIRQARGGLARSRVGVELLDPAYAAAAEIESAELQLEQARESVQESERGVRLQIRSLHDQAANAREAMANARSALTNARAREEVDRERLEAGLISEIAFQQTRLSTRNAEVEAVTAEHDYLRALYELQAEAAVAIDTLRDDDGD